MHPYYWKQPLGLRLDHDQMHPMELLHGSVRQKDECKNKQTEKEKQK